MKKSLFVLGVAVAALASCTNEETVQVSNGLAIGFAGSGVNNITKADITSTQFTEFLVYGGYGADKTVFNGQSVTNNSGTWSYSPLQYWEEGETYNFGAYAPKADNAITATWDYTKGLSLTVKSDAANQNDLVYADKVGVKYDDVTTVQPVALTFDHLLSKLQFKIEKEAKSLGGQKVEISNFKVAEIVTEGTWTKNVQGAASSTTGDYTDFATAEEVNGTSGILTDAWYVIPQIVSAFAVTANVKVTSAQNEVIKDGTITASVPTVINKWEAGEQYLYTATLTMSNIDDPNTPDEDVKPIEFTGSASDWTTPAQEGDVTFQ